NETGGVRGLVGSLPSEHRAVGAKLPYCLRQVPYHATRQCAGGLGPAGGGCFFLQRLARARAGEGEGVGVVDALGQSDQRQTPGLERALFAMNRKLMLLPLRRFRSSGVYSG